MSDPRIQLFYGNRGLLVNEAAEAVVQRVLGEVDRSLGFERFSAAELVRDDEEASTRLEALLNAFESPSMFSERVVVRIDQAELIKKVGGRGSGANGTVLFEAVSRMVSKPPEHLWVVLTSAAGRDSELSQPLLKAVKQSGNVQRFVAYDNDNPSDWVRRRAEEKGIRVSPQVAGLLIRVVGNDVGDLDRELEKLLLLHPDAPELTEAMVSEAVQGHRHFSVFAMVDALAQRDLRKALDVLHQQLEQAPREHVRLYMLVVQQFRRLLLISSMLETGRPQPEILKKLGLPGFLGKQAVTQARQFKYAELTQVYALLGEMELRLKFEAELAGALLREIFARICRKGVRA